MIHLDTNFLIEAVKIGTPSHARLREWIQAGILTGVSSLTWAEFLCGPLDSKELADAKLLFPEQEPLYGSDATMAAGFFNQTGRRSRSLADCMIAAVAIRCGAKLATANTDDFKMFVTFGLLLA